jgi:outer membrane biosynthesis protein TonB
MNRKLIALILSLFALAVAGCGGDDDEGQATTIPTVPLSVPGSDTVSSDDESTDTTPSTTPDATPTPTPTPEPAPAPTPTPTPQPQDTPQNDTPPPAGSEAEQFEDFCAENPGAC